jgi:hypothetical protein
MKSLSDLRVLLPATSSDLGERAATLARGEGPYSPACLGLLAKAIPALAQSLKRTAPPRGLEQVIRRLSDNQLAFLVLRALLNRIYAGWDRARKKEKKRPGKWGPRSPRAEFCQDVGAMLRDELELAGLLQERLATLKAERVQAKLEGRKARKLLTAADYIVAAGKPSKTKTPAQAARAKRAVLGKFRQLDWTPPQCARAGDWLVAAAMKLDCFDVDDRGLPIIAPDHKAALDEFAEDEIYRRPAYRPVLEEPAPWTGWVHEHPGRLQAPFIKADYPETVEAVQAAWANGWIEPHARAVSVLQSVPFRINLLTLELLRTYGGDEYKRDVAMADAINGNVFRNRIHCDWRGRLNHLADFNYTRGDPVRALFLFDRDAPIGNAIDELEISIANHYGVKGTADDRLRWVREPDNLGFIKDVAADPGLLWRCESWHPLLKNQKKKWDRYQFAGACAQYVAASRRGPDFETHLPCWRDAFSNGLQHMACLARDERLAALVGLESRYPENPRRPDIPDKIEEVREAVARAVKTRLRADKDHCSSQFWLEHEGVLGQILKDPVMTLPYGVTKGGMADQIWEAAKEQELKPPKDAVKTLRDHAWEVIGEMMPGAVALRDWLQDRVRQEFANGGVVSWVTPTGVPVSNHYRKDNVDRVVLPFLGENARIGNGYSAKLDNYKMENGIIANYVQSIESSHLARSVNAAVDEEIVDLATVHDCFASLAPSVLPFARIRRVQLTHLYHHNPLGQLVWRYVRSASDLPRRGKLDPLALQFSEHFDR